MSIEHAYNKKGLYVFLLYMGTWSMPISMTNTTKVAHVYNFQNSQANTTNSLKVIWHHKPNTTILIWEEYKI